MPYPTVRAAIDDGLIRVETHVDREPPQGGDGMERPAADCLRHAGVLKSEAMSFLKTHPFWALLIAGLVLAVLTFVLFVQGHGSGGMDLGPITPDRSGK